ncbi:alkaline phosphatase PhoX [Spirillospora sp. NPDC048911]|uniref:alkaline phosphatase PhoX n=1 Tax=Spirillospora sp. NPDC048911 TaxID=3364527 RepID=UPI003721E7A3
MERRHFLAGGATVAAGAALTAGPFQGVLAHAAKTSGGSGARGGGISGGGARSYGPLHPVRDLRDGEVRLHLPQGFRYRSFNPAGSALTDGTVTPGKHDGMAAFRGSRGSVILVRNHEINGPVGAFGDPAKAYDPAAGGGTCTLRVTPYGEVLASQVSLGGTQMNCSGGPMPWGSWVTCEETVNGPDVGNDFSGGDNSKLKQKHGYIFEVPTGGRSAARPIRKAGRFAHESAACDPRTGAIYLTEDNFNFPSGFYRYLPPKNPLRTGRLLDGGRLQMLAVKGRPGTDLSVGQPKDAVYATTWVDIDDPDPAFTGKPSNDEAIQAVGRQGRAAGAALFSRLEGAIYDRGVVYFVSTQGGAPVTQPPPDGFGDGRGQIWAYDTHSGRLRLVVESPGATWLDLPDNITHSRRGTLVLCEDGDGDNYLRGLTVRGNLFDFGRLEPIKEDAGAEFAGSTFAPDGRTLFVNIQSKVGMSFAIWGPWHHGPF